VETALPLAQSDCVCSCFSGDLLLLEISSCVSTCEAFLLEERSLIGGNSKASGQYDCVWLIYSMVGGNFQAVLTCEGV
jgi:hypothetical protein